MNITHKEDTVARAEVATVHIDVATVLTEPETDHTETVIAHVAPAPPK